MVRFCIFILIFTLTQCKPEVRQLSPDTKDSEEGLKSEINRDTMTANDIAYIMGQFNPKEHASFVEIPLKYADQKGRFMRKEALEAFIQMYDAAKLDGINMVIKSAARNFDYQKGIWERKYTGETVLSDGTNVFKDIPKVKDKCIKILEYSSMPGTSRHHWGTDIDINSFNNQYFEKGEGKILYDWMVDHAANYGYCQPYTPHGEDRPYGYHEEKWHWSYLPLSTELTRQAEVGLKDSMISGFMGSEAAVEIEVVNKYVLGINSACK